MYVLDRVVLLYLQSTVHGVRRLAQSRPISLILGSSGTAVQAGTCTARDGWGVDNAHGIVCDAAIITVKESHKYLGNDLSNWL